MNDLLTIYAILMTSLFIVYADYNKCFRNKKVDEPIKDEDSSTENINTYCSDKPIVAYGGTFNFSNRSEKSDRFKGNLLVDRKLIILYNFIK
jgi:hypothetical protein